MKCVVALFLYFESANRQHEHAAKFARDIDGLMREHSGNNRRLAVDKIEIAGLRALEKQGLTVFEGQETTELARVIKGEDEIRALRCSTAACEAAMDEMRDAMEPGKSENETGQPCMPATFAEVAVAGDTHPVLRPTHQPLVQESGPRIVNAGELLAFDTDWWAPTACAATFRVPG